MNAQTSLLNQKFESKALLKDKAQEYAKLQGFAVVTGSSSSRYLLLRCRHGGKPRNYRKLTDDDIEGKQKRQVVKNSMRLDCPWTLRAKRDLPYWVVSELVDFHNHGLGRDPLVYHQHRKLNQDEQQKLNEYIAAKASNIVIHEAFRDSDLVPKLLLKDIQNYRAKGSADSHIERASKLITSLIERNYVTRYESSYDRELKYLYFSHVDAVAQAQRFHEVVLLDTTYKTNRQGFFYVSIVGISNVGVARTRSLSTFPIAGAFVVKEDEYAVSWILDALKTTVYYNGETPIFVTDAAMQLRNSIGLIFHSSKHLLCTWHIKKIFETNLKKTFKKEVDWLALKTAIIRIINSRSEKTFQDAKDAYLKASRLSQNQVEVEAYLERRLKDAEMWVGMHTWKLMHFGATTTQRVEGSHASVKHVLEGRMNIDEVMERVDLMFLRKRQSESLKLATDEVSFDALLADDVKARLALLIGKITSFALLKIKEECVKMKTSNRKADCNCELRFNYNLPCQHTLPQQGAIPLGLVAKRWHLHLSYIEESSVPIIAKVESNQEDPVREESRQLPFKPNSTNIYVSNLYCNGSHGISVGSLGQYPAEFDIVENVYAYNISMNYASDGARVKVWPGDASAMSTDLQGGGGSGYVKNITFDTFYVNQVDYAIELTQCYGQNNATLCVEAPSKMNLTDITFKNIQGTTDGVRKNIITTIVCSLESICSNISASNINVTSPAKYGTPKNICTRVDTSKLDYTCSSS